MKLAVIGATGPTGQALIKEALSKGHQVVALVRSPDKITEKNDALTVAKVDIFKPEELVPHLTGCDAVLSGLGYHQGMSFFKPVSLYEDSMKSITNAMKQAGVSRVVCVTSWATEYTPGSPKIVEWFVRPVMIGKTLKSMATMEHFLHDDCPDINYTVVRPPELGPHSDKVMEVKAEEGQFLKVPGAGWIPKIARSDLARFMINCLSTSDWDRKAVAVGT